MLQQMSLPRSFAQRRLRVLRRWCLGLIGLAFVLSAVVVFNYFSPEHLAYKPPQVLGVANLWLPLPQEVPAVGQAWEPWRVFALVTVWLLPPLLLLLPCLLGACRVALVAVVALLLLSGLAIGGYSGAEQGSGLFPAASFAITMCNVQMTVAVLAVLIGFMKRKGF